MSGISKTIYEQSQVQLGYEKDERSKAIMMFNYEINQLKVDLDKANKRIFAFEGQEPRRKWLEEEVINRKKKIAEAKADLDTANKRIAKIAELTTTWELKNAPQVLRKIYDITRSNR